MSRVASVCSLLICVAGFLLCPSPLRAQHPAEPAQAHLCQPLSGQALRCPKLGFTFKIPFGWVDRTEYMQAQDAASNSSQPSRSAESAKSSGETMLAIFERPPGVQIEGVDPAVVIAAEPVSNYPSVKAASNYVGPLAELAEQHGLKMQGDAYAFPVGRKQLVRVDFTGGNEKTAVRQTSLVMIQKGYIVSFTFVAASDDDIDDLIGGLGFGTAPPPHAKK